MVRVIIDDDQMGQFDIDIAQFSGDGIEDDLRGRDFTLNAMAIESSEPPLFFDPLNGYEDLQQRNLRMCSQDSLVNDPMRALRAIRMSLEFDLTMDETLLFAMKTRGSFSDLASFIIIVSVYWASLRSLSLASSSIG